MTIAPIPEATDRIAAEVVECAFRVHRRLGPGLLESVYAGCLEVEFERSGLPFDREAPLPVIYEGRLTGDLRLDFVVGGAVVVEVKAVARIMPVHVAQTLTYLRLTGHRLGLLINFNAALLKDGLQRVAL